MKIAGGEQHNHFAPVSVGHRPCSHASNQSAGEDSGGDDLLGEVMKCTKAPTDE